MRFALMTLAAVGTLLSSTAAFAGDTYDITTDKGADYSVEFFDDDLYADNDGALGDVIYRPPTPVRRTLIRPRTSFVRQLIRTVEHL